MDGGTASTTLDSTKARWAAILAMTAGVFALVTAEFLPAGLLTPMADDLRVTEGLAGQAVTTTAATAAITGLICPSLTRHINRRSVLLAFSMLVIASDLLVATADGIAQLLLGRLLLGVALGGFWTMSTATIMHLVPPALLPRAVSVVYSGISAATVSAIPVGSYLSHLVGWRFAFAVAAGLGLLALIAQWIALPSIEPRGRTRLRTLLDVLMRPGLGAGIAAAILVFTGHYTFFTYVRPFLESAGHAGTEAMTAILLGFGVASFCGTYLAGYLLGRNERLALVAMPLGMSILGVLLVGFGGTPLLDAVLVALWGFAFGGVPVAWMTWITRAASDQPESANGLIVAAIGLAIALGAAFGGILLDFRGMASVMIASSLLLLGAVSLTLFAGIGCKGK